MYVIRYIVAWLGNVYLRYYCIVSTVPRLCSASFLRWYPTIDRKTENGLGKQNFTNEDWLRDVARTFCMTLNINLILINLPLHKFLCKGYDSNFILLHITHHSISFRSNYEKHSFFEKFDFIYQHRFLLA